jgi:CRISPR/Cas system-associated exonuclease Cas4 (RecB family)
MTIDIHKMLSTALTSHDGQRDRSKQVMIGPSAIGGCRRKVWHMLKQSGVTNDTKDYALSAIMGTYIHAGIAEAITREDPFGDNFLIEQQISTDTITGNVDLFIIDKGIVIDWKTTKVKSLRYFPSKAQIYQVQVYGWLLQQNGYKVNQVSLVAIPRDGEIGDIRVHLQDYDEEIALEGLKWLDEVREIVKSDGEPPAPEEKVFFCSRYCSYYDPSGEIGCPSTKK